MLLFIVVVWRVRYFYRPYNRRATRLTRGEKRSCRKYKDARVYIRNIFRFRCSSKIFNNYCKIDSIYLFKFTNGSLFIDQESVFFIRSCVLPHLSAPIGDTRRNVKTIETFFSREIAVFSCLKHKESGRLEGRNEIFQILSRRARAEE